MSELENETKQEHKHRAREPRTYGIFTKILGPMPRWLVLAFQVGAFATLTLISLVVVGYMIAGIVTGNFEAVTSLFAELVKLVGLFIPGSQIGGQ